MLPKWTSILLHVDLLDAGVFSAGDMDQECGDTFPVFFPVFHLLRNGGMNGSVSPSGTVKETIIHYM
jgi:hypothetical protein